MKFNFWSDYESMEWVCKQTRQSRNVKTDDTGMVHEPDGFLRAIGLHFWTVHAPQNEKYNYIRSTVAES